MKKRKTENWFTFAPFYDFIASKQYKSMVELGVWKGHSISYLADQCRGWEPKIYAVDLWEDVYSFSKQGGYKKPHTKDEQIPRIYQEYNKTLKKTGTRHLIEDIKGYSWEVARQFDDDTIDFVFIDADHAYESVCKDIQAWLPKVRKGGIIAGHDYVDSWAGVVQAVDEHFDKVNTAEGNVWWKEVE
jgi:predicted O-methyltransferase YrrM